MTTEAMIAEIESHLEWDDTGLPIGVWRPTPEPVVTPNDLGHYIDWIYVLYARGDLDNGLDRKNLQAVCVVDLNEQQLFFQIPTKTQEIFIVTREKLSEKNRILQDIITTNDPKIKDKYLLDVTVLPQKVQDELYNPEHTHCTKTRIAPVDLTDKIEPVQIKTDKFDPISDVMAWNGGPVTVGGDVGDTYPAWVACAGDAAVFAANGTATQTSALVENGQALFTNEIGVNKMTLNGANHLITMNHTGNQFNMRCTGSGDIDIYNLNAIRAVAGASANAHIIIGNTTGSGTWTIYNNVLDGGGDNDGNGIRSSDNTPVLHIYNNLFINFASASRAGLKLDATDGNANSIYENNTIYNCAIGADYGNNTGKANNETFLDCTTPQANIGGLTANTNNVTVLAADLLAAVTSINKADGVTFLEAVEGGVLADTQGANLIAGNTTDYYGVTRNAVGAKNYIPTPAVATTIQLRGSMNNGISLALL